MDGILVKVFYNFLFPIFALGVVVFVHEFGHFIIARLCGIKVLKFSIGFGPKMLSWKRKDTEYCISWLFFGGYVKFLGDDLDDEKSHHLEGSFYGTRPFYRTLTCLAGPCMNLLFGFLIYCVIFFMGRPALLDERTTVIGAVQEGSPAQVAGLMVADQILQIDNKPVSDWKDVITYIALTSHDKVEIEVLREGKKMEVTAHPKMDAEKGLRIIGISRMERILVGGVDKGTAAEKAGLIKGDYIVGLAGIHTHQWDALLKALEYSKTQEASLEIVRNGKKMELRISPVWNAKELRYMLGFVREIEIITEYPNPFTSVAHDIRSIFDTLFALFARTVSPKGLAGPVGILVMMGAFAKVGFVFFLGLLALISINLGVFNLLPIPVLDGGHILFNTIETIRRRALPKRTMIMIQNAFVMFLIFFIFYVTFQDLKRLGSNYFSSNQKTSQQEFTP